MGDKAGKAFWDASWEAFDVPPPLDVDGTRLRDAHWRAIYAFMQRELASARAQAQGPATLVEVGCARSQWLPTFAHRLGFRVSGIDYSETGAAQAARILRSASLPPDVYCCDVFNVPESLLGEYHAVFSFGVVEHFDDTAGILRAMARLLKPGGILITIVPNMRGLPGRLQAILNRPILDIHMPLSAQALAKANEDAGLLVSQSGYLMSNNFGVLNAGIPGSITLHPLRKAVVSLLTRLSMMSWGLERMIGPLPATKAVSPYVTCVAAKPAMPHSPNP